MANIKSAKKRILVIETKTLRNKTIKTKIKTLIKKVETAVAEGNKELAQERLTVAISEIGKAASKGIYHKINQISKRYVIRIKSLCFLHRLFYFADKPETPTYLLLWLGTFTDHNIDCHAVSDPSTFKIFFQLYSKSKQLF